MCVCVRVCVCESERDYKNELLSFFFFLLLVFIISLYATKKRLHVKTQLTSLNKIYYIYNMLYTTSSHISVFPTNVRPTPM